MPMLLEIRAQHQGSFVHFCTSLRPLKVDLVPVKGPRRAEETLGTKRQMVLGGRPPSRNLGHRGQLLRYPVLTGTTAIPIGDALHR